MDICRWNLLHTCVINTAKTTWAIILQGKFYLQVKNDQILNYRLSQCKQNNFHKWKLAELTSLQRTDGFTIFSTISCPLNEMALCLEIRAYFFLIQLCTWGILVKSWKTDHLKGVTQPPLRSHSVWYNVTISHFTKAKELIIPPFQFLKTKDHRTNNTQDEILAWWISSVRITANWSAEDRELQESRTGQQPRRLLMYWFVGLWNVDNLCHTFISFLWLSLVPSAPGPPPQNKQRLLLSQASINALCSRCHAEHMGQHKTHQGY